MNCFAIPTLLGISTLAWSSRDAEVETKGQRDQENKSRSPRLGPKLKDK